MLQKFAFDFWPLLFCVICTIIAGVLAGNDSWSNSNQMGRSNQGEEYSYTSSRKHFNTSRPRQNGRHFGDDTFKYIFLNKNILNLAKISLKFVPKGPVYNIPALVQIMAWRRPGYKPLSEPMVVRLLTQICVTRPQWVKTLYFDIAYIKTFSS